MKQDEILVIYKYIIMYTDIQMVNISESANNCWGLSGKLAE
jgi:hypothetical protein